MKNLILALVVGLLAFASPVLAQQSEARTFKLKSDVALKTPTQAAKDTAVNTTEKSQSYALYGYFGTVSIQTVFRKLSGTPAGKAYLEGSLSGAANTWDKADSVTVLNVANQTKIFNITPSRYIFYRVRVVGVGTQSTEFYSFGIARKQQ